jgi:hypothetical protein
MAKLVTKRAHERAKGSDLLPDRRPHPNTGDMVHRVIVAKKLGAPTAFVHTEGRDLSTRILGFETP